MIDLGLVVRLDHRRRVYLFHHGRTRNDGRRAQHREPRLEPLGRRVEIDSWKGPAVEPPPVKVETNPELEPGEVKQTDNPIEGMQAVIYRRVYLGEQELFKDQFVSEFVAWPERWEIGLNEDGSVPPVG